MPVSAPNLTVRYKVFYTGPFGRHVLLLRFAPGTTMATARNRSNAIIEAMAPFTWDGTNFDTAEYCPAGGSVFNADPDWEPVVSDTPNTAGPTSSPSRFLQWGGRDSEGFRAKWYLFECATGPRSNMRVTPAQDAQIGVVIDALSYPIDPVVTAGGGVADLKGYANIGDNDYLTHKARS